MSARLRLIWVVPSLAGLGGSEYAAVTFARLVAGDGHHLRLLTGPQVHPAWRELLQVEGLTLIEDPSGSPQALCETTERLLEHQPADLIQFMPLEEHCLAWLRKALPVPVIGWEPTDLSPQCWWLPAALKTQIHDLNALLVLNPCAARHAREHYDYRGPVTVLPNTLNGVPAKISADLHGDPVVGCIARLSAEKGLEYLLAAFSLLLVRCPRAILRLWGEGEDLQRLENLAKMLGIESQVQFVGGFEPFSGIDEVAASADVFALSSLFEGAPVALLELAARGRPVVASRTSGARWVCGEDYPWLPAVGDTRAMADALADALNGQGRETLGEQLYQRFHRQFAARPALAALNAAYADVLSAGVRL
ncbi:glycosyltransferase [Pseudomonas sp. ADAK18]|uniref:glycosyltransferase n=1 Tax=Pseudomonas sp. ADAK18 TaxID=2730848 RepID=UPI0014644C1F|nr:glycosyltransferase [Pseudomonas sp. ADAK18]QJI28363.1 glycosyltransferase [Pseudomonas sp. ADAK18]